MLRSTTLLLTVRAENQASGALRTVASDIARLGKISAYRNAQAAVAGRQQALQLQRSKLVNAATNAENAGAIQQLSSRRKISQATIQQEKAAKALQKASGQRLATQNALNTSLAKTGRDTSVKKEIKDARQAQQVATKTEALRGQQYANARSRVKELTMAEKAYAIKAAQNAQLNTAAQAQNTKALAKNLALQQKLNRSMVSSYVGQSGRVLQSAGRAASMFGMVAVAAFGGAAYMAAKFATSVSLAATQTRTIGKGIEDTAKKSIFLQGAILKQMALYPASSQDMSQAAYDIYSSLDISLGKGTKVLEVFNKAAIGGQTDLQSVTQAGITVMNDFRINSVGGLNKAMNTLFASVRFGRMTFQQLTQMMPQMAPAFSAAGYGIMEMAQAAAFMTRVMPNTARASTSLARLVEMFGRKDFVAGAAKMGARITDIHHRLLPLPQIVERLAKAFPAIMKGIKSGKGDVELANIFKTITAAGSKTGTGGTMGTIQGRRAMIFMITQLGLMRSVYKQVAADQNEFVTSYNAMKKTPGVQFGIFINQLKALAIELGAQVIPVFGRMAKYVQRLLDGWEKLDNGTKNTVAKWGAISSVFLLLCGLVAWV